MKKLPIGTQAFEVLRKEGNIYVDKTERDCQKDCVKLVLRLFNY